MDTGDQFRALLRAFADGAFDIDGVEALKTKTTTDAWTRHLLLGTPHPETEEKSDRRDWPGMQRWFRGQRQAEQQFVTRSLSELKKLVWSFVREMHRAVGADNAADVRSKQQLERLRAAVNGHSFEDLKREALQASEMLTSLMEERESQRKHQLAALGEQLRSLSSQLEDAKRTSETDALTGLYNRRALDAYIERVVALDGFTGQALCVLMIDIDHFKQLNDTKGHAHGDEVLAKVGDKLACTFLRKCDFVARYGGEEFTVVMRDTNETDAARVADRFRQSLQSVGVTASVGVARLRQNETAESWFERADKALYEAKHTGRDRVIVAR